MGAISSTILEIGDALAIPVGLHGVKESNEQVRFETVTAEHNPAELRVHGGTAGSAGTPGVKQWFDSVTNEAVDESSLLRGVYGPDGKFYEVPEATIESLKGKVPDSIRLDHFIPRSGIPEERIQKTYYLAPQSKTAAPLRKPLKLLHDALVETDSAGIIRLVPKSKEALAVVYPKHGGLFVSVLAWPSEFRDVRAAAAAIEVLDVNPKAVALTAELIRLNTYPAEVLEEFEDSQLAAARAVVELALAGEPIEVADPHEVTPVLDGDALLKALEASVKAAQKRSRPKAAAKSPRASSAGRKAPVKRSRERARA